MNTQMRKSIEEAIVTKLIDTGLEQGYYISVDDGDGYKLVLSRDKKELLGLILDLDECSVSFDMTKDPGGLSFCTVDLAFGNDGYDVISDYGWTQEHEALVDKLIKPVDNMATAFEEGKIGFFVIGEQKSDYQELAERVTLAQKIHEESYVKGSKALDYMDGKYTINLWEAARQAARNENEAYLISMLNQTAWNDIQTWANIQLGVQAPDALPEEV